MTRNRERTFWLLTESLKREHNSRWAVRNVRTPRNVRPPHLICATQEALISMRMVTALPPSLTD